MLEHGECRSQGVLLDRLELKPLRRLPRVGDMDEEIKGLKGFKMSWADTWERVSWSGR